MYQLPTIPSPLLITQLDWQIFMSIIKRANAALGRYDELLRTLPNPAVLLSPVTTNETVLSSRVEGTQATLEEVMQHDAGIEMLPERSRPRRRVILMPIGNSAGGFIISKNYKTRKSSSCCKVKGWPAASTLSSVVL